MIDIQHEPREEVVTVLQEEFPQAYFNDQFSEAVEKIDELAAAAGVSFVTITIVTGSDLPRLIGTCRGDNVAVVSFPLGMPPEEAARIQQTLFGQVLASDGRIYTVTGGPRDEVKIVLIAVDEDGEIDTGRTCDIASGYEAELRQLAQDLVPQRISYIATGILDTLVHGMRATPQNKTGEYILVNGEHEMIMRGALDPGDVSLHYWEYFGARPKA